MIDPLEHLARDDKWQLGAGDGTLFAPTFPRWLDAPGFWDGTEVLQRSVDALFTVTVLDSEGRELEAQVAARRWTPAELTLRYRLGPGITATEVRTVHPGGIFVSEWRFAAFRPERIHLVAWTAQPGHRVERDSAVWHDALQFVLSAGDDSVTPLRVRAELACVGGAESWGASRSEGTVTAPEWRLTPFVELARGGVLASAIRADGTARLGGTFFAAVERSVNVEYAGASVTFAMRVVPDDAALRPPDVPATPSARQRTFSSASRKRWADYFAGLPAFRCSDPYLERMYWYRWFTLRLNAIAPSPAISSHPSMREGPGMLHCPRAVAAAGQVRELRWMGDPMLARGVLLTFFVSQRQDGGIPARIAPAEPAAAPPVHADWGEAIAALDSAWPDDEFIRELHPRLVRFAEWLVATRDAEGSGMFDLAGDDASLDIRSPLAGTVRIKGIDATVWAYSLFRLLEHIAPRGGGAAHADSRWKGLAERTRRAVRKQMWNEKTGMFSDVDAESLAMTNVKTAHCFLPYRTDLATEKQVGAFERHLLSPKEFFTAFPVTTLCADDPRFSAEGEWRSRRAGEPWNGRSRPAMNGEVVDALAHVARTRAPALREHAATLLRRFVHMMFHDGELPRVNSHEHYNPFTGHASVHRGLDDVQHSWINDLIIRHVMGINPTGRAIVVDPLPFGLEHAEITAVKVGGRLIDVVIDGTRVLVTFDGEKSEGTLGTAMSFPLG